MDKYGKILVVEDDSSLAQWVIDYLTNNGFECLHADRGDIVVEQVKQHSPDLILLDVMLPGLDGYEVCKQLRQFYQSPIIMLTAKADEFDEVLGLELGATDYLTKPVRPRALLTRIKALLRRSTHETDAQTAQDNSHKLNFGALSLDADSRRAQFGDTELDLTTTEFDLLWLLASNAGEVLDRDTVFKVMKGWEYDGLDRRIDVLISSLRRKVGDTKGKAGRIKTVWGKGYLFVADAWNLS
ncbi:response regulator transcription factor [Thaumasiovibrio subtropicus]|nr:response regulator transcription factor [Thaumasiovibrio subtropicus]